MQCIQFPAERFIFYEQSLKLITNEFVLRRIHDPTHNSGSSNSREWHEKHKGQGFDSDRIRELIKCT